MAEPIRITIILEGGLIQNVLSEIPVEYVVIDYDTDGSVDGITDVPQLNEFGETTDETAEAFVHHGNAEIHLPFVKMASELEGG